MGLRRAGLCRAGLFSAVPRGGASRDTLCFARVSVEGNATGREWGVKMTPAGPCPLYPFFAPFCSLSPPFSRPYHPSYPFKYGVSFV